MPPALGSRALAVADHGSEWGLRHHSYPESSSALGYVHSVTEGDAPALPKDGDFTSEFRDFLSKLVTKDPKAR